MNRPVKQIAVIVEEGAPYGLRLLEGAIRYTEEHPGIQLRELVFDCGKAPFWLRHPAKYDGILLWASASERWVEQLIATGTPIVNACGSWPLDQMPTVAFDGGQVVQAAVNYLEKLGRTTAGLVLHSTEDDPQYQLFQKRFSILATRQGMLPMTTDLGPQRSIMNNTPRLTVRGKQRLRAFLRCLPLPASLWAMDDCLGYAIIEMAKQLELDVPSQLAVLGLGDYTVARYCHPQLSTIPQPGELVGFEAMGVLEGIINGQPPAQRQIGIPPPPVVVRESTLGSNPADEQMRRVHEFIVEHACRGISVDDVLRLVPMSLPTLHKRFEALYGRTPGAEIRRIKVVRAKYYLRTTNFSISRVAELCGYDQQGKFANFFKRETDTTPSAYRTSSLASKQNAPLPS